MGLLRQASRFLWGSLKGPERGVVEGFAMAANRARIPSIGKAGLYGDTMRYGWGRATGNALHAGWTPLFRGAVGGVIGGISAGQEYNRPEEWVKGIGIGFAAGMFGPPAVKALGKGIVHRANVLAKEPTVLPAITSVVPGEVKASIRAGAERVYQSQRAESIRKFGGYWEPVTGGSRGATWVTGSGGYWESVTGGSRGAIWINPRKDIGQAPFISEPTTNAARQLANLESSAGFRVWNPAVEKRIAELEALTLLPEGNLPAQYQRIPGRRLARGRRRGRTVQTVEAGYYSSFGPLAPKKQAQNLADRFRQLKTNKEYQSLKQRREPLTRRPAASIPAYHSDIVRSMRPGWLSQALGVTAKGVGDLGSRAFFAPPPSTVWNTPEWFSAGKSGGQYWEPSRSIKGLRNIFKEASDIYGPVTGAAYTAASAAQYVGSGLWNSPVAQMMKPVIKGVAGGTAKFLANHPSTTLIAGSAAVIAGPMLGGAEPLPGENMSPPPNRRQTMMQGTPGLVQGLHRGRHAGR